VVEWDHQAAVDERAQYESRIPLGRAGTVDDAAAAVIWLALDARYVTGTVVRVDGGRALR
jgi:NAD(P)-dependent dehydrogenase (short-subunit alcohol dehydrogenase family)